MRKYVMFALVATLMLAVGTASAADSPQKPGKWQMKMEMEIPGMPVKMPPITMNVCLTEEDLKDPQKSVPNDPKSDCKVGDYKVDGNTVSWTMSCPKQNMTGDGEITFTDDSYSGRMNMKVGDYKVSGNTVSWSVDCPKQKTKGTGEITYTDNSYTGAMNMTVGEQEMKTKYSGKWMGECKK